MENQNVLIGWKVGQLVGVESHFELTGEEALTYGARLHFDLGDEKFTRYVSASRLKMMMEVLQVKIAEELIDFYYLLTPSGTMKTLLPGNVVFTQNGGRPCST